jgi:membrane protein YdbS with pleckstrin-like domain
MPLPRKLLNEDEELLAEMRPHWLYFSGPLAAAAAAWAVVLAIIIGLQPPAWANYPLLAIGIVPTAWLVGRLVRWRAYTLALTSTRILVRQGVLGRDTVQLRLQRITEINIAQTLPERMLATGRLVIDVQGEDDSLVLEFVQKPAVLQRVINSQINELIGGGSREAAPRDMVPNDAHPDARGDRDQPPQRPTPTSLDRDDTPPFGTEPVAMVEPTDPAVASAEGAGPSPASVHEKLIELDDLRRRGILTEEEFAAKKAQLLDRI